MPNLFSPLINKSNMNFIERDKEIQPIFEDFNSEYVRNTVYTITGPRGCGKTVTLSHILDIYRAKDDWIVARLTQSKNMLEQLASILYDTGVSKIKQLKLEFSFSFSGLTFQIKGEKPVTSISTYLEKLFKYFTDKGIHILIAIDDVAKNEEIIEFVRAYQGFLIDHYDIRLLMTGLRKNITKLENDKTITFLHRSPKIMLSSLSIPLIADSYRETFNIEETEAIKLAKFTKGYAMAYQLLGDILFRNNVTTLSEKIIREFDLKIGEWSYDIIWDELTISEQNILTEIAKNKSSNQEIMDSLGISKGNLAIYKKKLADEGIINTSLRGKSEFVLPRFDNYILEKEKYLLD